MNQLKKFTILFLLAGFQSSYACNDNTDSIQYCLTNTSPKISALECQNVSCSFKYCMESTTLSEGQCINIPSDFQECVETQQSISICLNR